MHVESLGVAEVVGTPDAVDQLTAGEHATRVAQQQLEQLELLERHGGLLARDGDRVALDVHAHVARLENEAILEAGDVRMDVERHTVSVGGSVVAMPLKEFELLELLMRNAGRVLTRGQLIDRIWGADYFGDTKTLDVHIQRIRSRIEKTPSEPVMLVTVRGLGYRFEG